MKRELYVLTRAVANGDCYSVFALSYESLEKLVQPPSPICEAHNPSLIEVLALSTSHTLDWRAIDAMRFD